MSKRKRPGRKAGPSDSRSPRPGGKVLDRGRVPRSIDPEVQLSSERPRWRVGAVDFDGPWSWSAVPAKTIFSEVITKLHEFETMHWGEFRAGDLHHDVSVEDLCSDAQRRLRELGRDDLDSLFSIRLTAQKRVWAKRVGTCLHVLWWDPNHQVCPSRKKHT